MKIIRHLGPAGPAWAALQTDGTAREIVGEVPGEFHVTGTTVVPGALLAPVVPPNIFGIGLNYRTHAAELGRPAPDRPMVFMKGTNAVQHPGRTIDVPHALPCDELDYEGELAVVIGRAGRNISRARALDHVLGYTVANDISARDWQFKFGGGQFCQGKSFDTFCPLGPVLVTRDEVPDPGRLRIRTLVNGELRQDGGTDDMIFDVPALIEFLSAGKLLMPGTVILTGTPGGVGFTRKPPVFLRAGDRLEVTIDGIGTLVNTVRAEPV